MAREQGRLRDEIPTEEDWHSEPWDPLEIPYALKSFARKSIDEATELLAANALSCQEDLCWMPAACLRYYIQAYVAFLLSDDSKADADAASAFFGLIKLRQEDIRAFDNKVASYIADALRHLSANQSWFDADEDIYGDFVEHAERSLKFIE